MISDNEYEENFSDLENDSEDMDITSEEKYEKHRLFMKSIAKRKKLELININITKKIDTIVTNDFYSSLISKPISSSKWISINDKNKVIFDSNADFPILDKSLLNNHNKETLLSDKQKDIIIIKIINDKEPEKNIEEEWKTFSKPIKKKLNENKKSNVCHIFMKYGKCSKGEQCNYAHSSSTLIIKDCFDIHDCKFVIYDRNRKTYTNKQGSKVCKFRHTFETEESLFLRLINNKK